MDDSGRFSAGRDDDGGHACGGKAAVPASSKAAAHERDRWGVPSGSVYSARARAADTREPTTYLLFWHARSSALMRLCLLQMYVMPHFVRVMYISRFAAGGCILANTKPVIVSLEIP